MTPSHHPDPDELMSYAAGSSPEWLSLVLACHLTFCPACRTELSLCEALGGALLDRMPGSRGDTSLRERPSTSRAQSREPRREVMLPDRSLPRPLAPYFQSQKPRFRFLAPGVQHVPLSIAVNGAPVRVVRFRPGFTVPRHGHEGPETLVIFRGTLHDSRTNLVYGAGDLCRTATGDEHCQRIGGEAPCVSLIVNEGSLVPKTWPGRLLKWATRY